MRVAVFVLLVSLSVTGIAAETRGCELSTTPFNAHAPVPDLTGTLPAPDYLDTLASCSRGSPSATKVSARPTSTWLVTERKVYSDALARSHANVLVVPFQIQGYGLDRVERALMTADFAYALGDTRAMKVADPFLTSLALGEGVRRVRFEDAAELANRIGAHLIVVPFVGHDSRHTFTVTVQTYETGVKSDTPASMTWQRDWRALAFTDENTPALVFHDLLPEVLNALPLRVAKKKGVATKSGGAPASITGTPLDLISKPEKNVLPAATFALLGALTPPRQERAHERLFERALLASLRSQDSGPDARFFQVYSLMNLERRPVALARLVGMDTPPFKALRALLNGDLPTAQEVVPKVTNPLEQLLLQIELRDLEITYGAPRRTASAAAPKVFSGNGSARWTFLLDFRSNDLAPWSVGKALAVKGEFDAAFPLPGFDASSVVRGASVARGEHLDDLAIDIAIGRHARRIAADLEVLECCSSQQLRPSRWDLLWLLEAISERRVDRMLRWSIETQGLPQRAISDLARYEPFFSGHPALSIAGLEAANELASTSPDDERESWQRRARDYALGPIWWAQGQDILSARAVAILPHSDTELWVDAYGYDYPRRADWPLTYIGWEQQLTTGQQQVKASAREALAFSRRDPNPLAMLVQFDQGERDALVETLSGRFVGHAKRLSLLAEAKRERGLPPEDPMKVAQAAVKADPENWNNHFELGRIIFESGGAFKDTQTAFLAYAPFTDHKARNAVQLSNEAYTAGSLLYLHGAVELARPFYQIAAQLGTGSEASMSSAARLLTLDGRYLEAMKGLRQRAVRYSSPQAYRDYLSFVHALGEHDAAWTAFSQIQSAFELPQVWVSALVGHRMQGLDDHALRAWLRRPENRGSRFRSQILSSWYAVIWSSTDRVPPADLGAFVEEIEGAPVAQVANDGWNTMRPQRDDPHALEMVSPSFFLGSMPKQFPTGMKLKSERAYFADAYAAVARGDYEAAVSRFIAMAEHYPMRNVMLPYFAYAAAKTGDKVGLEKIVNTESQRAKDFDMRLAQAFFAAFNNDIGGARMWLDLAQRMRPSTDDRPVLSEFQYAQACEWLFRDTRDAGIRTILLEWLKSYQRVQPAHGWAYAMQYSYETDPAERVRALAMARYLEPSSHRVQGASKAEMEKAQAWFRAHDPFTQDADRSVTQEKTARVN